MLTEIKINVEMNVGGAALIEISAALIEISAALIENKCCLN